MRLVVRESMAVSASVSCMDLMHMADDLEKIHASKVSFLHFDVVDGVFNNCFILGTPTLEALRPCTELPIETHLAVMRPENFIRQYIEAGSDYIAFHLETQSRDETLRLCDMVRDSGARPTLALRVETLLQPDDAEILQNVDWVLMLLVQPGFSGQAMNPAAFANLRHNAEIIREYAPGTGLQADGNVNLATIPDIVRAGADILTGGTSGLFRGGDVQANAEAVLDCARQALQPARQCETISG